MSLLMSVGGYYRAISCAEPGHLFCVVVNVPTYTCTYIYVHVYRLLDTPVTVACGHSFCQDCLSRSFDHTPFCPMCRSPLAEVTSVCTYIYYQMVEPLLTATPQQQPSAL